MPVDLDILRRVRAAASQRLLFLPHGAYQIGVASIQCMYAPEFNSHSGACHWW